MSPRWEGIRNSWPQLYRDDLCVSVLGISQGIFKESVLSSVSNLVLKGTGGFANVYECTICGKADQMIGHARTLCLLTCFSLCCLCRREACCKGDDPDRWHGRD